MHNLAESIRVSTTVFSIVFKYLTWKFGKKGHMLYNPEHKFTVAYSETSELSIYFCSNELVSILIKTAFFKSKL